MILGVTIQHLLRPDLPWNPSSCRPWTVWDMVPWTRAAKGTDGKLQQSKEMKQVQKLPFTKNSHLEIDENNSSSQPPAPSFVEHKRYSKKNQMARTSSLKVRKLLETVLLVGKNLLSCLVSLDTYKDGPLDCSSKKHPKVDKSLPNPDQIIGSPTSTCFCNSNPYLYLLVFPPQILIPYILNKELSFDLVFYSLFCCPFFGPTQVISSNIASSIDSSCSFVVPPVQGRFSATVVVPSVGRCGKLVLESLLFEIGGRCPP